MHNAKNYFKPLYICVGLCHIWTSAVSTRRDRLLEFAFYLRQSVQQSRRGESVCFLFKFYSQLMRKVEEQTHIILGPVKKLTNPFL